MRAILPFWRYCKVGESMITRVVLCGVGGQGTILAAHVLAQVALCSGLDVKVSEIHGMSQRGGSVITVVTFGDDVSSMVCGEGQADIIVSFDALEAIRNVAFLKVDGKLITSDSVIKPSSVLTGKSELPINLIENLQSIGAIVVPADASAKEAGNRNTSNVVMLGALAEILPFEPQIFKDVIVAHVPEKTIDANVCAFDLGLGFAREHLRVSEQ